MNHDELIKEIRRCGMATFITYYSDLNNQNILNKVLIDKLIDNEGYTKICSMTKIRSARNIIKKSKGRDALLYIASRKGKNAAQNIKLTAVKLLREK
jgi:hypothetical protein